jgi:tetratricopeptide (TPR) repeat protein
MSTVSPTAGRSENNALVDPLAEARERQFPPLRNRTLAEAAAAIAAEQVTLAEAILAKYLKKKPREAEALNLMADVARRSKRYEQSERLLSECLKLAPDNTGYRYNHAIILRHLHNNEEALAELDRLLAADPNNPLYRDQKAVVLTRLGRHGEALAYRRNLVTEFPDSAEIWLRYAHTLRDEGFRDESIAAFHRALALAPTLVAAWGSLATMKVYRFTPAERQQMEVQLARSEIAPDDRAALHHALGKAYGDAKNYAKSFENYAKSNALRRMRIAFDGNKLAEHRTTCERFFNTAFFRERAGWGCDSRAPIFIVGMPRSGSTLLEQILSSHSAIEGLGERADLDITLLRPLAAAGEEIDLQKFSNGNTVEKSGLVDAYAKITARLNSDRIRTLGEEYLEIAGRSRTAGRARFTDKTLRNFFYVGLIQLILPNAKIIDARRHPLDCGWSCFKSQFPGMYFALRLADIGEDYSNYVRLMDHFDRVLPGRVHRVIYERLIADPRAELLRLFAYLELPFEEACLRFHENPRAVATQSSEQVRQPLYASGMAQWVPYEPWLGPLKAALGPVLAAYPDAPEPDATQWNSGTAG